MEQLERENRMFQEELRLRANNTRKDHNNNNNNNELLLLSEEDERIYLTQELDQARRELTKFRKEMDGLSAQLNDMASEMVHTIHSSHLFFLLKNNNKKKITYVPLFFFHLGRFSFKS